MSGACPNAHPSTATRQRRIGLTGGIASGKSMVARILAERFGLPVIDADVLAHEALAPGTPAALAVHGRYGNTAARGTPVRVDRAALGRLVFADPGERQWLEKLIHPRVRSRFEEELQRLASEPALLLVIPLLFEAGLQGLCSEIWLVDCEPEQQLRRLMARSGLSEAEALARIHAQWPLERKRPLADRVLDNRATVEALTAQVVSALADPSLASPIR